MLAVAPKVCLRDVTVCVRRVALARTLAVAADLPIILRIILSCQLEILTVHICVAGVIFIDPEAMSDQIQAEMFRWSLHVLLSPLVILLIEGFLNSLLPTVRCRAH